jgi:hypothetical protein
MPVEELSPGTQFLVLLNQFLSLFIRGGRKKVSLLGAIWGLIGLCLLPFFAAYVLVRVYGPVLPRAYRARPFATLLVVLGFVLWIVWSRSSHEPSDKAVPEPLRSEALPVPLVPSSPSRVATATTPRPPTMSETAEVQRLLQRLGYAVGVADGIAGPRTVAAVRAFQASRGLPVTGDVDTNLLEVLRNAKPDGASR